MKSWILSFEIPVSYFHGSSLKNIGFGLTGRGYIGIVYQDSKRRVIDSTVLNSTDGRFNHELFLVTHLSDPATSGIPAFGDCGSPGIVIHNKKEFVISLVSCLVADRPKIITASDGTLGDHPLDAMQVPGLMRHEIEDETFMDNFLLRVRNVLNRTGNKVTSLYDGSWSCQIFLPFHRKWIEETLQQCH